MKKIFLSAIFCLLLAFTSKANVSDTIHISHYIISIDTIALSQGNITANTQLTVVSKQNNINTIPLALLQLTIDSIISQNQTLTYSYNDTTIYITSPIPLQQNDSVQMTVYYHGHPKIDPSGWGGYYAAASYAFNLGVGFQFVPHNLGKIWFPCVDEFTDKSTYEFIITTASNMRAQCNGYLFSQTTNANGTKTWHWKIDNPIPTYLACMAVASYTTWDRTVNGIPVQIAALPSDTAAVSVCFQHLSTAVNAFTNFYGPYPFNKIGYSLVNFNSGAMEHASNISVGRGFITAGLTYETLWAHELSHQWWGDKVTCETAGDMWLNEGWATYNEYLFTQQQYGDSLYKNAVRTNHRKVLEFAHITDGSYLPLINIPDNYTYSQTVYNKGGDVVHTLRNFLGDSLFSVGCHAYMNNRAYANGNSYNLRDDITSSTGIDATHFFDDWIFTPGFPHFSIDSVVYISAALEHYYVYTRQRAKGNINHIYKMPIEITFSNGLQDTTVKVTIDSATNMFHIPLVLANAQWIALDRYEKVSDAISDFERTLTSNGTYQMPETNTSLVVTNAGATPSKIRIENNWVAPDGYKQSNPGIRLSDYHYWKVDGILDASFVTKCNFYYNGSLSMSVGYIDNTLITGVEDSLVLVYRQNTADDWHIVTDDTLIMGNHTDKTGRFLVDTLRKGEYTFGYRDYTVGANFFKQKLKTKLLSATPNPAQHSCKISFILQQNKNARIKVCDINGKEVYNTIVFSHQDFIDWDCNHIASGKYIVSLLNDTVILDSLRVVIAH